MRCNKYLQRPNLTCTNEDCFLELVFSLRALSDMGTRSLFKEYLLFDFDNVQYIAWPDGRVDTLAVVRILPPTCTTYM